MNVICAAAAQKSDEEMTVGSMLICGPLANLNGGAVRRMKIIAPPDV